MTEGTGRSPGIEGAGVGAVGARTVAPATVHRLRDAYDGARPRVDAAPSAGLVFERIAPGVVRTTGRGRGFVESGRDLGVEGAALDALIAAQQAYFGARGEAMEWKTRAHDHPADLPERLLAAGFVPDEVETVVVGESARTVEAGLEPAGIRIRTTRDGTDFARIAALESSVWGDDRDRIAVHLARETTSRPEDFVVVVAEDADGVLAGAAWLDLDEGNGLAGLWGGSTLPAYRRRGVYRALVAARARIAVGRGVPYLQVDASSASRPILEALGFVAVTTTTPYGWEPGI